MTDSPDPTNSTSSHDPTPSAANGGWVYLVLIIAFTLYGLSHDVTSGVASTLALLGFFAFLFVPYLVYRVRTGRWREPTRQGQRWDAATVLVCLALIAVALTIGFAVPRVLVDLGTPLPYTLCWFSVGVLLYVTAKPLSAWSSRRREGERSDGR